jgi:hypothetical protein
VLIFNIQIIQGTACSSCECKSAAVLERPGEGISYPVAGRTSLLCISASSTQSERDFSSVGHTITNVRSRLSVSKVEAIELVRWGLRAGLI